MIPFFDTQAIVQTVLMKRLDVWSLRTQTVCGDDAREVRMSLAQRKRSQPW
jgi:hypothetical protein